MARYFGQVNLVIEADDEATAELVQQDARKYIERHYEAVVEAMADEPVEFDEFGHAG